MQRRLKFERIQVLRFVAVAAVVAYHAQLTLMSYITGQVPYSVLEYGQYGVDLFFVISGFIIVYIGSTRETTAATFACRRVRRIVPMYWIATIGVFVLSYLPGIARSGAPEPARLVQSLLFLSWLNGPETYPVLNVGWTLEYEMLFYVVATLAMVLAKTWRTKRVWAIAGLVLLVLVLSGHGSAFFLQNPIIIEFVFGMVIAAYMFDRQLFPWLLLAAILVTATLPMSGPALRVWLFGIPSALLVAGAIGADIRKTYRGQALAALGNASYSIYLTHVIVISLVCKILMKTWSAIPPGIAVPLISIVAISVGYAAYRLIETRLIAFLGRNDTRRLPLVGADRA